MAAVKWQMWEVEKLRKLINATKPGSMATWRDVSSTISDEIKRTVTPDSCRKIAYKYKII